MHPPLDIHIHLHILLCIHVFKRLSVFTFIKNFLQAHKELDNQSTSLKNAIENALKSNYAIG